MSVEELGDKLQRIVLVENDRPMLKFIGSPFFGGKGIDGDRKLFGSVQHRKFKVWENATRLNSGFLLTYVNGVFSESGTGTRVLLRARASRVQRLSLLTFILSYWFFAVLVLVNNVPTVLGSVVMLAMGLLMLLAATIPFIIIHRSMAKTIVRYLEEELSLIEEGTSLISRK